MRRSVVAASAVLAVGGSLAIAASASATSIPTGTSTDSTNASLYGLYNQASTGLIQAQNLIVLENGILEANNQAPIDSTFGTAAFTSASQLTATNVAEIGTDIAASANTSNLEFGTCVSGYLTANNEQPTQSNVQAGATYCQSTPSALSAAATKFTGTIQPGVASAAASWGNLQSLVGITADDPTDFPGGFYTVDNDVSISSTATVTAIGKPAAYSISFGVTGAAAKGYVLPSAFTLTFPANFTINTALVGAEIQASQESSPPAASAIGTATVTSPVIAALVPGSKGVDSMASVYAVATSSLTQPDFEVYLGQGIYILGSLTGVTFPLTVSFSEPVVSGKATPLPVSSVTMSFPAATSPLEPTSCTDLGTLTGTMTDSLTTLASTYFGDSTDSGALNMAATPTVVTNNCMTTVKSTLTASASGLTSGTPTFTFKVKTGSAFSSETISLASGLKFAKSKKLSKQVSASGAKIKSVKVSGGKLVVTFKSKVTSATVKTKKGAVNESAALIKKIKKHKTKKLTLKVKAGSTSISTSIKA